MNLPLLRIPIWHSWRVSEIMFLEIGDRAAGNEGRYPNDNLKALLVEGKWKFVNKDDTPHE
jgi:hypothetical protein